MSTAPNKHTTLHRARPANAVSKTAEISEIIDDDGSHTICMQTTATLVHRGEYTLRAIAIAVQTTHASLPDATQGYTIRAMVD